MVEAGKRLTLQPRTRAGVIKSSVPDEDADRRDEEADSWDEINEVWEQAHGENALLNAMLENVPEPRPLSLFARLIIVSARTFAGTLMFLIWFVVVGPIWIALLLRTISSYSAATVVALFTHASPPDVKRLDAVAELWPNGFRRIANIILQREPSPERFVPIDPLQGFLHTLFAIIFYTGIVSSVWTVTHLDSVTAPFASSAVDNRGAAKQAPSTFDQIFGAGKK